MRSAPSAIGVVEEGAELDLGVAQHVGIGRATRPVLAQELAKTRSLYSAAKLTTSISMPIMSATEATSIRSWRVEQYSRRRRPPSSS
jgi:hypothetical protein